MQPLSLTPEDIERFWAQVDRSGNCWLWTRSRNGAGYGQFYLYPRTVAAHRFSYELTHGPIPPGQWVAHKCEASYPRGIIIYRRCVNPAHLHLRTPAQNATDARSNGRLEGLPALNVDQVLAIRWLVSRGMGEGDVAKHYGVAPSTIHNIVTYYWWSDLP